MTTDPTKTVNVMDDLEVRYFSRKCVRPCVTHFGKKGENDAWWARTLIDSLN